MSKSGTALIIVALALGITFVLTEALPYLRGDEAKLARYDGKRAWILVHIALGTVALLVGPLQL